MGRRALDHRRSGPTGPLVGIAAGIAVATAGGVLVSFRVGGLLMALVLVGCAVGRAILPVAALGPLAVRSRTVDVATCVLFAAGLAVFSLVAPGGDAGLASGLVP